MRNRALIARWVYEKGQKDNVVQLVKRKGKRGKTFYGCERYPDCDFVSWDKPTNIRCEKCGGMMVQKIGRNGSYVICMDKDCGHILRNTKKAKEEDA